VGTAHKVGDLVHIPQAVQLIDCSFQPEEDPQMVIPLAYYETPRPEVGVVVYASPFGYLRVFCSGHTWSVKGENVYGLGA
jgi:hypothetical protein